MKDRYLIEGRDHEVIKTSPKQESFRGNGFYLLEINGNLRRVELIESEPHQLDLIIDGKRHVLDVVLGTLTGTTIVAGQGWSRFVEERSLGVEKRRGDDGRPRDDRGSIITPPFPSILVKILVSLNDLVVAGDHLAIVSAMKMEMTLKAKSEGIVASIPFTIGASVSPGDEIIVIKSKERGSVQD